REAVSAGREDLAKIALERKSTSQAEIASLTSQIADIKNQQDKLIETEKRLSAKIESFRSTKETIKAQYSAAEAQVKITESVSGISEEMSDVGMAVQRAKDKTENMKARASALDELVEAGTLEDVTGGSQDDIDRELSKIKSKGDVDMQLEALKKEMGK
ncbi:MAG: PspA/IM30 family protein, partial [Candidatus Methanoperedens sp.]|nr:PspA/IM30 family protein [Candidatus Methanoperedens sp.]